MHSNKVQCESEIGKGQEVSLLLVWFYFSDPGKSDCPIKNISNINIGARKGV